MAVAGCCPNCGHYDWSRAPLLSQVRDVLAEEGAVTVSEVAERCGLSFSAASNRLAKLVALGVARVADYRPNAAGRGRWTAVYTMAP